MGTIKLKELKKLIIGLTNFGLLFLISYSPIQRSPHSTEELKVYIDDVYGYSIKYPSTFYLSPTKPEYAGYGGIASISNYDPNNYFGSKEMIIPDNYKIEIGILGDKFIKGINLTEFIYQKQPMLNSHEWEGYGDTLIDGRSGVGFSQKTGSYKTTIVYFADEEVVYFIYGVYSMSDPNFNNIFSTMLSSFVINDKRLALGILFPDPLSNPTITPLIGENYRLPFIGQSNISNGPGEGQHINRSEEAIDFALPTDYEVRAMDSGVVTYRDRDTSGFGNIITIRHTDGSTSYYAHLSAYNVFTDQNVNRGDEIGYVGNTGCGSCGFHLHFEVRRDVTDGIIHSGNPFWVRNVEGISWNVDANGNDCPPCFDYSGSATSNIVAKINYLVKFQGVNSQISGNDPRVKFRLTNSSSPNRPNKYIYSIPNSEPSGVYRGKAPIPSDNDDYTGSGDYYVLVKGPSHLQRKFVAYLHDGDNYENFSHTPLKTGDVRSPENEITIEDISIVISRIINFVTFVGPNTREDLNFDKKINIQDAALVAMNWNDFHVPGEDWDTPTFQSELQINPQTESYNLDRPFNEIEGTEDTSWIWSYNLSRNPGRSELPSITRDKENNIHAVWYDNTTIGSDIYYSKWSNNSNWSTSIPIMGSNGSYPSLAVDQNGTVHVVWQQGFQDINYSYKTENGDWSIPQNISNTLEYSFFPEIAVDSDNKLHVVWENWVSTIPKTFYIEKSTRSGWSTPVDISSDVYTASSPDINIDNNDGIHVVWAGEHIQYIKKPPFGNWEIPENITNDSSGRDPAIAIASDNSIHVVWENSIIFYSTMINTNNWSPPIPISGTSVGELPSIALDGTVPHIVWGQSGQVYYTTKTTPIDWVTGYNVSSSIGEARFPVLDVDEYGILHILWNDNSSGNTEIHHTFSIPDDGIVVVNLVPETEIMEVGKIFPVDIKFNTSGLPISTIAIRISYEFDGTVPDLEVIDGDPDKDGTQLDVNPDITQAGWSVRINSVEKVPGRMIIEISLSSTETEGLSTVSDTVLARINFLVNQPIYNKILSFDKVESQLNMNVEALNVAKIPLNQQLITTGKIFIPLVRK